MHISSKNKGKALFVFGILSCAAMGILLHFHYDLAAGVVFGMGVTLAVAGLTKIKRR